MQSRDCDFWRILTATFNILQSHFELWLQFSTFCSHISNYDCNFLHFAVTFRIMTATFELWLQLSNYDCKMLKIAVTWLQNPKLAVRFRVMTATFNILQSHFELWLQLSTFCSHISNYDCKMLKVAVTWLQISICSHNSKCDCKMLKVAVIIRKVTAKCWKLQSFFKKIAVIFQNLSSYLRILRSLFEFCSHNSKVAVTWLQIFKNCSHITKVAVTWLQISKCDCKMLKVAITFRIMTAIFNILRSHFEICNHVTATFNILQS